MSSTQATAYKTLPYTRVQVCVLYLYREEDFWGPMEELDGAGVQVYDLHLLLSVVERIQPGTRSTDP
jgi:hypothetical protein